MQKNKLPEGAVRQKMTIDGIAPDDILVFFGKDQEQNRSLAQHEQSAKHAPCLRKTMFSAGDLLAVKLKKQGVQTRSSVRQENKAVTKANKSGGMSIAAAAAAAARTRAATRASSKMLKSDGNRNVRKMAPKSGSKRKRSSFGPPCVGDICAAAKKLRSTTARMAAKMKPNKKQNGGLLNPHNGNTRDFIQKALRQKFQTALPATPSTPGTPW